MSPICIRRCATDAYTWYERGEDSYYTVYLLASASFLHRCSVPHIIPLNASLLDPAHIPISHHATQGGGDRKNAVPINFEVSVVLE